MKTTSTRCGKELPAKIPQVLDDHHRHVSFAESEFCSAGFTLTAPTGSNDHSYRHPRRYQRLSLDRGYRLVWQRLHVDCRHIQSAFWPHLPALFDQMGVPRLHPRLWRCWHLLRRHNDHRSPLFPSFPFAGGLYSPPFSVWLLVSRRCSAL